MSTKPEAATQVIRSVPKDTVEPPKADQAGRHPGFSKADRGGLSDFVAEKKPRPRVYGVLLAFLGLGLIAALATGAFFALQPVASAVPVSQLALLSEPAGADVIVDGESKGVTPLTLALSPGHHAVELRRGEITRALAVTLKPGVEVSHHVDLGQPPAPEIGHLQVSSEPAKARVTVDGRLRGVTPLTVADLSVGEHAIEV
jgi:hypothetical protein